jgi:hypothetical protein
MIFFIVIRLERKTSIATSEKCQKNAKEVSRNVKIGQLAEIY